MEKRKKREERKPADLSTVAVAVAAFVEYQCAFCTVSDVDNDDDCDGGNNGQNHHKIYINVCLSYTENHFLCGFDVVYYCFILHGKSHLLTNSMEFDIILESQMSVVAIDGTTRMSFGQIFCATSRECTACTQNSKAARRNRWFVSLFFFMASRECCLTHSGIQLARITQHSFQWFRRIFLIPYQIIRSCIGPRSDAVVCSCVK